MDHLISVLSQRGLIDSLTHSSLPSIIDEKRVIKVYCGFDPTAESLHVGNLVALIVLAWFRRHGHNIVVLIGGATGMIGDPSGKRQERKLLNEETLIHNVRQITAQVESILSRIPGSGSIEIVNNRDWYKNISCIDFLRDIGKEFRIGAMISKESVRARLQSEEGMSYTEFSYQVLQGYDFLHLFSEKQTSLQIGGSDQWGNITAGVEHIRKVLGKEAYGLTFPLLLKQDGQKFGKSEKGALWLSSELFSAYELYQYFIRVSDQDVIRLLKVLTFIDADEIDEIERSMKLEGYVPNSAQKRLSEEVVAFIHGVEGLHDAQEKTQALLPGHEIEYTKENIDKMVESITSTLLSKEKAIGRKIIDILFDAKILPSLSEARRLIKNQGLTVNGVKIVSDTICITEHDLIDKTYFIIGIGKKMRFLMEVQ